MSCRLCGHDTTELSLEKLYLLCNNCNGIQLSEAHFLSAEDEKNRYQQHNNDIKDPGYRKFLSQLLDPLIERIPKNATGLDYGSGPNPSLSVLFKEKNVEVKNYDPYFADYPENLSQDYDFITCSETAEHFKNPADEFKKINALLKPAGTLGLMTLSFDTKKIDFENWFYRKDPTHVFFYQLETLEYISKAMGWKLQVLSERVFVFLKPLL